VKIVSTKRVSRRSRRKGSPEFFSVIHFPEVKALSILWHAGPMPTPADLDAHRGRVLGAALLATEPEGHG
jgi:hypothetical protein